MGLIPKVKCSRCDKSYSGLKNKCPYCGAHRGRGGKRASDTGDATARLAIKGLLLLALVITVISMIVLNLGDDLSGDVTIGPPAVGQEIGDEGDTTPSPPTIPSPPPTPTPVTATSLEIDWQFRAGGATEMTIGVGDELIIWADVFPTDTTTDPGWDTSAPTVVNYRVDPDNLRRIEITGRSRGYSIITVTVDDLTAEVIVRVR